MSDKQTGRRVIDAIVEGSLLHASCPDHPEAGCMVVWRANAAEQIGAAASRAGKEAVEDAEFLRGLLRRFGWNPEHETAETWLGRVSAVYRNALAAVQQMEPDDTPPEAHYFKGWERDVREGINQKNL